MKDIEGFSILSVSSNVIPGTITPQLLVTYKKSKFSSLGLCLLNQKCKNGNRAQCLLYLFTYLLIYCEEGFGSHLIVLRAHFWLFAQGLFLAVLRKPYVMMGLKPKSIVFKQEPTPVLTL